MSVCHTQGLSSAWYSYVLKTIDYSLTPPRFYCPQHQILSTLYNEMQLASRIHCWNGDKYSDKLAAEEVYDLPCARMDTAVTWWRHNKRNVRQSNAAPVFKRGKYVPTTPRKYSAICTWRQLHNHHPQLNPITHDVTRNSIHTVRNFARIFKPV